MASIESIKSKAKSVKKNKEAIRDKFSKLEIDLKETFGEIDNFYASSKEITLSYYHDGFTWFNTYGRLCFHEGKINVITYSQHDFIEDIEYNSTKKETIHISECRDDWFDKLLQKEAINSLLSNIDNSLQDQLETSETAIRNLESALQSQSSQLAESCQKELEQMGASDPLKDWISARDAIEHDPADSVTRSSSYIESVCRTILKEQQKPLPRKKEITNLIQECLKVLKFTNDVEAEEDAKRVIGSLGGVTQGVGVLLTHTFWNSTWKIT